MPQVCSLLVWKYLFDTEQPILDVLAELGWEADGFKDFPEDVEKDRQKLNDGVHASLTLAKKHWPHDYAMALKLIPDDESARYALQKRTESVTGMAFAPEGSVGFYRRVKNTELNGMPSMGHLTVINAIKDGDFVKALKFMADRDKDPIKFATEEVEFPPPPGHESKATAGDE